MTQVTVAWNTGTSITIPSDFGSLVAFYAIGAGRFSGGAFAKITSLSGIAANNTYTVQIGVVTAAAQGSSASPAAQDTWLDNAATILYAQGSGASAGLAADCVPTTGANSGGAVGSPNNGGGGGAGGPNGAGAAGVGNNGAGGAGDAGSGGAAGTAGGGAGGAGAEWTYSALNGSPASGSVGPGGGGGAASGTGGNAGQYGAGGGKGTTANGAGTGGLIVLVYNQAASSVVVGWLRSDDDRQPTKRLFIEASSSSQQATPVGIAGMAWFEPWDHAIYGKPRITDPPAANSLIVPSAPVGISGIAWSQRPDEKPLIRIVRDEAPRIHQVSGEQFLRWQNIIDALPPLKRISDEAPRAYPIRAEQTLRWYNRIDILQVRPRLAIDPPAVWGNVPSGGSPSGIVVTNQGTQTNASTATISQSPSSNIAAGSAIIVFITDLNDDAIGSVSDVTNTYTLLASQTVNNDETKGTVAIFYALDAALTTSGSITYSSNGSGNPLNIGVLSATGILTTAAVDTPVTGTNAGTASAPSVTSGSPSAAGDLFVGMEYINTSSTPTQPSGWTNAPGKVSTEDGVSTAGYQINAGAGALTYNPGNTGNGKWGAIVGAFLAASSPAPSITLGWLQFAYDRPPPRRFFELAGIAYPWNFFLSPPPPPPTINAALLWDDQDGWGFYLITNGALARVSSNYAASWYRNATTVLYNPFLRSWLVGTLPTAPTTPTQSNKDPNLMQVLAYQGSLPAAFGYQVGD